MNAGIADAMNLSWMLAGVIKGWADPALLGAYEIERRPITEQVSKYAMASRHYGYSQYYGGGPNNRGGLVGGDAGT